MNFVPFPSIEGFHNVRKFVNKYTDTVSVSYRGKIKLHGTNSGIRLFNGEIAAQSRTQIINTQNDNCGFAKFVFQNENYWKSLSTKYTDAVIFGEWCGPGIQKGTAIQKIPNKIFAVFAIVNNGYVVYEPEEIKTILGNTPPDVYVLPWYTDIITVEYKDTEKSQIIADDLNKKIKEIEQSDPWVKQTFNVEGVAEGIVFYPIYKNIPSVEIFTNYVFKAKGEEHKVVQSKEPVHIDPEVAENINKFVDMFVTNARLEQGLTNIGEVDIKNTGNFIKWVCMDIEKESKAELQASGFSWKQVCKQIQDSAKKWFIEKMKNIKKMKKVFYNYGYEYEGYYTCRPKDYEYKNKTNKNILQNLNDEDVKAFIAERREVYKQLREEMLQIAISLNLHLVDFNGEEFKDNVIIDLVCVDNEDGKKLYDALISKGWEKEYIPIGP